MIEIPASVREKLEQRNFWQFVTLNEDGSATASPVWADVEGQHIVVNTATGRRKEKNVRRDPRVVLAMVDLEDPYSWAEIRGNVVDIVVGQEADDVIDRLARKYLERLEKYSGPPRGAARAPSNRADQGQFQDRGRKPDSPRQARLVGVTASYEVFAVRYATRRAAKSELISATAPTASSDVETNRSILLVLRGSASARLMVDPLA